MWYYMIAHGFCNEKILKEKDIKSGGDKTETKLRNFKIFKELGHLRNSTGVFRK